MGEYGQVVEVLDNKVKVKLKRTEACAKCRACTAGFSQQDMYIIAKNDCSAKQNDSVEIELDMKYFFKATFILYLIPLFMMLLGFFLGFYVADIFNLEKQKEVISFVVGIIFLLLTYFMIKIRTKNLTDKEYTPVATKVVSQ